MKQKSIFLYGFLLGDVYLTGVEGISNVSTVSRFSDKNKAF